MNDELMNLNKLKKLNTIINKKADEIKKDLIDVLAKQANENNGGNLLDVLNQIDPTVNQKFVMLIDSFNDSYRCVLNEMEELNIKSPSALDYAAGAYLYNTAIYSLESNKKSIVGRGRPTVGGFADFSQKTIEDFFACLKDRIASFEGADITLLSKNFLKLVGKFYGRELKLTIDSVVDKKLVGSAKEFKNKLEQLKSEEAKAIVELMRLSSEDLSEYKFKYNSFSKYPLLQNLNVKINSVNDVAGDTPIDMSFELDLDSIANNIIQNLMASEIDYLFE